MTASSQPKALVVDDEAEVREVVSEFLTTRGFQVLTARDGLEALPCVKRERPAVVVLDLIMPRLGGLEALRRIRAFHPEAKVVIVSGHLDGEVRRQALALGAAGVLDKPFYLTDLLAALGETGRPARTPTDLPGERAESREPPVAPAAKPGRILIVDDDAEFCAMVEESLNRLGYSTRSVADGARAFWALMQEMPDVVLLDIAMPGLSSVEVMRALRVVSRDVAIIMVSGATDVELAQRALAYGAFDYITKPVDMDYLRMSVETALTTKTLSPE